MRMVCRLCLVSLNLVNKVPLFHPLESNVESEVVKMIAKYLHIEIAQYDGISTSICQDCCNHLEEFHSFSVYVDQRQHTLSNKFLEVKCEVELTSDEIGVFCAHSDESLLNIKDVLADSSDAQESVHLKCEPEEIVFIEKTGCTSYNSDSFESTDDDVPLKNFLQPNKGIQTKSSIKKHKRILNTKNMQSISKMTFKRCADKNDTKSKLKSNERASLTSAAEKQKESVDMDLFISKHMPLKCELCGMTFDKFCNMHSHFKKNHGRRSYVVCCGNRCGTRKELFEHIHWHLNPEYFKCDECGHLLKSRDNLVNHKLCKHHKTEDLIYNCEICEKKFARQYILNQHLMRHQAEKKYSCQHCNKSFKSKQVLEKHIKSMHENIFPHICDVCGKKYKFKPSFDAHVLEHQGIIEPPVQCNICGEWKMNKNRLRKHVANHNKVDVQCMQCKRMCPSLAALRAHVGYVHRAPLKFQCKYCEKCFKTEINLKEHVAIHTGQHLYNCPHCSREFRSRANMYVHIKRQHSQEWTEAQLAKANITSNIKKVN